MSKQKKQSSKHTIDLGHRVDKINRYRAEQQLKGRRISSIEKAVNEIIDKFLDIVL